MTVRVRSRRRERTRLVAAILAVALVGGLVAAVVGAIGGDDDATDSASPTSTTIDTGGIEVSAPDGWTAIPVAGVVVATADRTDDGGHQAAHECEGQDRGHEPCPLPPAGTDTRGHASHSRTSSSRRSCHSSTVSA